jgi:hypothetical protein
MLPTAIQLTIENAEAGLIFGGGGVLPDDFTDLENAVDALQTSKANTIHTHVWNDITDHPNMTQYATAENLGYTDGNVTANTNAISLINGEITNEINVKLATHQASLSDLSGSITATQTMITNVINIVDQYDGLVDQHETKITTITGNINTINTQIIDILQRLTALEENAWD